MLIYLYMYIYQSFYLFRGDLYQSWEKGMEVFEELLLDADWALNAGNWMWLSASAFFHQYYRYLYVCLSGLPKPDIYVGFVLNIKTKLAFFYKT